MKTLRNILILAWVMLFIENPVTAQSSNTSKTSNKKNMMSITEQNKATVRAIYEQALNLRNFGLLKDLISPDFTGIRGVKGPAGFEEPVAGVIKAVPDAQWNIESLMAEGNQVFIWWKVKGTNTGPFQGLAATGNAVVNDGVAVMELKDGKVIASQVMTDRLHFLQQLEVLPADITVLYTKQAAAQESR